MEFLRILRGRFRPVEITDKAALHCCARTVQIFINATLCSMAANDPKRRVVINLAVGRSARRQVRGSHVNAC